MKTKLIITAVVLGIVYLTTNYYYSQHTAEIFVLASIILFVFFVLWDAPEKHTESGTDDQIDNFKTHDGSHLP